MLFGLLIQSPYPRQAPLTEHFSTVYHIAMAARDNGFDFVTTGHEYVAADPSSYMLSPLPLLARLAGDLPNMRLMTGVILVPLDHPLRLANEFATMDAISDGRLDIGMGLAYRPAEFQNFGVDIKERAGRFDESLDIMRLLFTQDTVTYEGRYYHLRDVGIRCRTIQQPHPPFWIGGYSDAAVKRAAKRGDGWYAGALAELTVLQRQVALYQDSLQEMGRPGAGKLAILRLTWIEDNREKAIANARAHSESSSRTYTGTGLRESLAEYRERPLLHGEALFQENWLVGDPDDIYEQIKVYVDSIKPDRFIFRILVENQSEQSITRAIQLLGCQVLPRLRDHNPPRLS